MKKILTLLTLAALLLVGCADMGEPNGTQQPDTTVVTTDSVTTAVTTDHRGIIDMPEKYTDLEIKAREEIWKVVGDKVRKDLTINDLDLYSVLMEHKGAFIVIYLGCPGPAPEPMLSKETVLNYEFQYGTTSHYKVLFEGKFYTLQSAYDEGVFIEEDIRIIWEADKAKNAVYYD